MKIVSMKLPKMIFHENCAPRKFGTIRMVRTCISHLMNIVIESPDKLKDSDLEEMGGGGGGEAPVRRG